MPKKYYRRGVPYSLDERPGELYLCPECSYPRYIPDDARARKFRCAMPRVRLPGGHSFKCEFLTTASSWRYQHTTTPEHGEATKLVLEAAVCEVCDETAWVSTIALKREIAACSAAVVPWMNPSGGIHLLREPDEGKEHEKSSMTPKAVARGVHLKYILVEKYPTCAKVSIGRVSALVISSTCVHSVPILAAFRMLQEAILVFDVPCKFTWSVVSSPQQANGAALPASPLQNMH